MGCFTIKKTMHFSHFSLCNYWGLEAMTDNLFQETAWLYIRNDGLQLEQLGRPLPSLRHLQPQCQDRPRK